MKRRAIRTGQMLLVLTVGWFGWRMWNEPPSPDATEPVLVQESAEVSRHARPEEPDPDVSRVVRKRRVTKPERKRYRRAIRDAVSRRQRSSPDSSDAVGVEKATPEPAAEERGGQHLTDRSDGKLTSLLRDLQEDVMPLAEECYELARERDPTLEGGLDLQFEVVGDEDVGGLVEGVELLESSDLRDDQMVECMRETLLSTIFPAPDGSGATGVKLSLRFSPEDVE